MSLRQRFLSAHTLMRAALLFAGYLLAAELGFNLSAAPTFPTIWPPIGVALAALLLSDLDDWPLLLLVVAAANLTSDLVHHRTLMLAVAVALVTLIEVTFGATTVRRFAGPRPGLTTVRQVIVFCAFAVVAAPALGGLLGALAEIPFHLGFPVWMIWSGWFIGDVAGIVVVGAPLLIAGVWWSDFRALDRDARRHQASRLLLSAAITAVFTVLSWYVFTVQQGLSSFKFLLFPGILAVDLIGGPIGGALYLFSVAIVGLKGIQTSTVISDSFTSAQALKLLQGEGFFIVAGITSLALAAAIYESRRLAAAALNYAAELQAGTLRLEQTVQQTVAVLGRMVETRDPYTSGHEVGVALLAKQIAQELGLPSDDIAGIEMAGLVHDIGKLAVPTELLTKPGHLSDAEFTLIKSHARAGYEILRPIDFDWPVAETVLQHHERLDGSGYPDGISGDTITLPARILAVADVIEAMGAHRPYRPALGLDMAIAEVRDHPDKYDPDVAAVCIGLHESGRISV